MKNQPMREFLIRAPVAGIPNPPVVIEDLGPFETYECSIPGGAKVWLEGDVAHIETLVRIVDRE